MPPQKKYYVVWAGHHTGVYDNWEDCKLEITNFPNARYKSFPNKEAAIAAYRGDPDLTIIKTIASHTPTPVNYAAFPEIKLDAIAVDAACAGNPGPVEYRGVSVATGEQLFHVGPMQGGSNNMGEFLAIVHALALLHKQGKKNTPIYSDSLTGMAWVRNMRVKTTILPTEENAYIRQLLQRATLWLLRHPNHNPVLKWDTDKWGEIPADFGRK